MRLLLCGVLLLRCIGAQPPGDFLRALGPPPSRKLESRGPSVPHRHRRRHPTSPTTTTTALNVSSPHHVAVIHIPKTGGSSIADALSRGRHPACSQFTGGLHLCSCRDARTQCLEKARVAVIEAPYRVIKGILQPVDRPSHRWLWVGIVRSPEKWFYSAVGQWCAGRGAKAPGVQGQACKPGATLETLLRAKWFAPHVKELSGEEVDHVKYYFLFSNLQTKMLGDLYLESDWLVCAMSSLHVAVNAIRVTALSDTLEMKHDNVAHWPAAVDFRKRVPWALVQRFFVEDQALHTRLSGGCVAHTDDPATSPLFASHRHPASNAAIVPEDGSSLVPAGAAAVEWLL